MKLDLPASYAQLSDTERKVLQTLAAIGMRTSITTFINCLGVVEVRHDRGILITAPLLKPILYDLVNGGWVDMASNFTSITCKEKYKSPIIFDMIDQETFVIKVRNAVNRFYSPWAYHNNTAATVDTLLREARFALFQGKIPETIQYLRQIQIQDAEGARLDGVKMLFFSPFDKSIFERFHPDLQNYILEDRMRRNLSSLQAVEPLILELVEESLLRNPAKGAGADGLALYAFLRGDFDAAEKLIKTYADKPALQVLAAVIRLVRYRDYQGAVDLFGIAQKNYNQINKTKTAYLLPQGLFYALALIAQNTADSNAKAEKYINAYLKVYGGFEPANNLRAVLFLRRNALASAEQMLRTDPLQYSWHTLFALLGIFWVAPEKIPTALVFDICNRALSSDYAFVAYEIASMMSRIDVRNNDFYKSLIIRTRLRLEYPHALHEAVERLENWEIVLSALQQISAGKPKQAQLSEGATRLVWLVEPRNLDVQPKEQTLRKNGSWSGGRNVALARLRDGSVSCITPQDHKIIAKSLEQYTAGWYGNTQYEINGGEAITEMVGHPLLFLMDSPSVSFSLAEEPLNLIISERNGLLELRFSVEVSQAGHILSKETPTRYKLLRITQQHVQIAQALGGSVISVPIKAKQQILDIVSGLSGMVQVQSTLDETSANTKNLPPDPRIYLHLLPVGDGFYVEFFVRPLGDTPPYCRPGEGEEVIFGKVNDEAVQSRRKLKTETKALKELLIHLPELENIKPVQNVYEIEDIETCLRLLVEIEPLRREGQLILEWPRGEKFKVSNIVGLDSLSVRVKRENDWFGMTGEVKIDEENVLSMQDLLQKVNASKNEFIELSDGKFVALTKEFRRRLREIETYMQMDKAGNMQVHPLAATALNDFGEAIGAFAADAAFKNNLKKIKAAFKPVYLLPEGFNANLRPYQNDGYQWLQKLAAWGVGACLADDMGLGKTVQALALMLSRAHLGPTLVIAPVSVCGNWLRESDKFTPRLKPVFFGEGDRKEAMEAAGPYDVLVCTYGLLQREGEMMTNKQFATIVLDEAQAIKNKDTKRSEIAMKLKGDFKIITTGTPIENHLGEIWNLFNFINPGLLGSLQRFNEKYAIPIEKNKDDDARNALKRLLQPFILRRRKDEVLKDLPAKTEIVLDIALSTEERAFYEALRRQAIDSLTANEEGGGQGGEKHLKILAEIMRLRRACCNPALVEPNVAISSTKLSVFEEIVEELIENNHKALVFSQFTSHLALLKVQLDKKGIKYQYLDGSTPARKRQELIDRFQGGEGDLFLISLKAGGSGLNLTAADYVIHMDPWWNPAVEDQATDRAHRIGQDKPVTVYRLVTENTIESKILKLHEHKRDLADQLLSGADMSARLTADDLLDLLKA